jgi:hypothetical protein
MHRLVVTRGIMGVHSEDEKIGTGEAAIAAGGSWIAGAISAAQQPPRWSSSGLDRAVGWSGLARWLEQNAVKKNARRVNSPGPSK